MTRLLEPVGDEPAGGTGVDTAGDDIYEAASEVDTTSGEPGEVPSTDIGQTPHTDEPVGKDAGEPGVDPQSPTGQKPAGDPAVPAKPASPAQPQPSEDERIAKIAAAAVAATRQQAPAASTQQQQEELSPEQIKQLLNPVEVTPELLAQFGIENASPQQVQAYQTFANNVVRNAVSVANLIVEQKMRENLAPYEPYVQFIAQQQAKQHVDSFYTKHGELQKYGKFVELAAKQLSPTKADGTQKSADEVYDEVAASVKAMLAEAGVTIASPSANPSAVAPQGKTAVPKMAAMTATGRSQGGQPSGEQNNPDADIYT